MVADVPQGPAGQQAGLGRGTPQLGARCSHPTGLGFVLGIDSHVVPGDPQRCYCPILGAQFECLIFLKTAFYSAFHIHNTAPIGFTGDSECAVHLQIQTENSKNPGLESDHFQCQALPGTNSLSVFLSGFTCSHSHRHLCLVQGQSSGGDKISQCSWEP